MSKRSKNSEFCVNSREFVDKKPSTNVERTLQKQLFMQNKPNFMRFYPKNEDSTKKQSQTKPIQSQIPNRPKFAYTLIPQGLMQIFSYSSKIETLPAEALAKAGNPNFIR